MIELTSSQQLAISLLSQSGLSDKFYWTGGTLLSYKYLHHRKSLDLDFFTEKSFAFEEVNSWIQKLKTKGKFNKINYEKICDRWEFFLEGNKNLRIEFVLYNHDKKTLNKREKVLGVFSDSLEDIAANKIVALFDRNEPKDLFDIYFIITKAKIAPKRLLELAGKKFGVVFSLNLFWSECFKALPLLSSLNPLIYEKDKEQLIKNIEEFIKSESSKYLKNILK